MTGLVFFHPHDSLLTGRWLNGLILWTELSALMWSRLDKLDPRMSLLQLVSASCASYVDAYWTGELVSDDGPAAATESRIGPLFTIRRGTCSKLLGGGASIGKAFYG